MCKLSFQTYLQYDGFLLTLKMSTKKKKAIDSILHSSIFYGLNEYYYVQNNVKNVKRNLGFEQNEAH